ncbi:MAG TPA: DUF1801 domain-containing protein [Candidatus Limnocylindria bacterium]
MPDAAASARIDAILGALPEDQRRALQAVRETVAATAPEAVEAISYGMPAFRYRGRPLVGYAGFKKHCSFFPMGSAILDAHTDEVAPFRTAKGTLQFTPEHPMPMKLVEMIVRERMAAIDAR